MPGAESPIESGDVTCHTRSILALRASDPRELIAAVLRWRASWIMSNPTDLTHRSVAAANTSSASVNLGGLPRRILPAR